MIHQIGSPILRAIAEPVTNIHAPEVQQFIDTMERELVNSGGVGIAAPQLGKSWRMLFIFSRPNRRYPYAPLMSAPLLLINPQILAVSQKHRRLGRLPVCARSTGSVKRYRTVSVQYYDRWENSTCREFTDFLSRILQHEYDHLEGKLFVDHVAPADLITEVQYQALMETQCTASLS
jgi:N-formylmethionyl-tRNA deformylase